MHPVVQRLRERKLVQWVLAYLAIAWLIVEAVGEFADRWGIPLSIQQSLDVLFVFGFLLTLVLAWYHGEKGRQRVSGPELIMISGLFALAAIVISLVGLPGDAPIGAPTALAAAEPILRDRPAIAVLPFANLSAEEANEYFALGIHYDILTQLSKIDALDVIARTSVMQYVGTEKTIPEIARELDAATVVQGGVQRAGDRVRINVQLIEGRSDTHLWAETYDRELSAENIFAIQTEIALEIANALASTLTPREGARISRAQTVSLDAYDLYLRGREAYGRYTLDDNDEAIRLFREALAIDPEYARAWAGLGDAFGQKVSRFTLGLTWADSSIAASERAIALDPDLADGYKALALAHSAQGRSELALQGLLRTLELDPSHVAAMNNLGITYFSRGDFPQYHLWNMRAFRIAPNSPGRRTQIAWSYWQLGDLDVAERWAREALVLPADEAEAMTILSSLATFAGDHELAMEIADDLVARYPPSSDYYKAAAGAALFARDFDQAVPPAEQAVRLDPAGTGFRFHFSTAMLGMALLGAGETERGLAALSTAEEQMRTALERNDTWEPVWEMASIHAARGEVDEAIRWARRGYEEEGYRFPGLIAIDPMFDRVRDDPRFQDIVQGMRIDVEAWRRQIEEEETAAGVR